MKKVNRMRKKIEAHKKYFLSSLALMIIVGAGAYGIIGADADTHDEKKSIIEKIAEKFSLDKNEVQKVFDEDKEERKKIRQENFEKKLSEAVTSGELTEAQKSLIISKKLEMEKEMESKMAEREQGRKNMNNLTEEERKAKREKEQLEMETRKEKLAAWAKENGIDLKYLIGPMDGHGGPRMHEGATREE